MIRLKLLYLAVGLVLLDFVLHEADLAAVADQMAVFGWGAVAVMAVYLLAFIFDSIAWSLTIARVPLNAQWIYRFWKVRMIGEAYNNITPFASMGGEPVKALILKSRYGVPFREGIASIVLARTTFLIALVAFLCSDFLLVVLDARLSTLYKSVAALGLGTFTVAIVLFFLAQRFRVTSRLARRFLPNRLAAKFELFLGEIDGIEEAMVRFYTASYARLVGSVSLAFGNWVLGVVELYLAFLFLGHPIDLWDAWIIETLVQLVRAAAFFVPAAIGVQDGTFLVITAALTGNPTLGVSAALVRRGRELLWIAWGLVLAWIDHFQPPRPEEFARALEEDA